MPYEKPPANISESATVGSSTSQEASETATDSLTSLRPSETSTLSATLSADSSSLQPTSLSVTESASTTTDAATSSTIAPTSTSSPILGTFNAIGQGGGASNTPARLPPPQYGSITLGGYNPSDVGPGVFSIEAGTGALFVDGSKICGFYGGGQSASVYVCNATPRTNEAPITCEQGQTDGGALKCSAPIMNCIEDNNDDNDPVCYATGGVWTQFMGFQLLGNYYLLSIGSQAAATGSNVPISLIIQAL
ncbi:uncharacterized protein FSUBG_14090 [Fusarium subglutinans]|uniref:Uncharacterized protein n=1 Tax=Gibberella subglutinans TaxID=42677 RepID=A0A8H5KGP6_GIBSU|nr:uncharacterized protein FSUBG_14090 [Fusarium subglutinans]KAF5573929.1 hypothetical protein FSUBG_14090 [Fusarium subglutinans]